MPKNHFPQVFEKLKAVLEPYEKQCIVVHDNAKCYYLDTPQLMKNKQRLFFGAVRLGAAYVSFHLMPVYACPDIAARISTELKKRMQGKSCFNFKTVDDKLFRELEKLTKLGFSKFSDPKVLQRFNRR